jgi:oxygen-independent coproporphyrinogen-3 oxidase
MPNRTVENAFGIYVHWPWCKAKCPYCDFNSHAQGLEVPESRYVEAVCDELRAWKERLAGQGERGVASVFFGGGTPSLMTPASVAKILSAAGEVGAFKRGAEVTVECNPTSSSKTLLKGLREAGVNRVSIGVQGLRAAWLDFLGRRHDVGQALRTLEDALEVFGNVNADVIYGLPGQHLEEWLEQLEKLGKMGLTHLSAYQLTVEKNTRFFKDVARGAWTPVDSDTEADFFEATQDVLTRQGYENYEISNFAKPGMACVHNRMVWQGFDYLGVGAGAHGRMTLPDGTRRVTQVIRQPEGYLARMEEVGEAFSGYGTQNGADGVQEAFLLGLRLAEGIDLSALKKRFGNLAWEAAVNPVELAKMVDTGFLEQSGARLRLSATGWGRLNSVLKRIFKRAPLVG